jgi:hypothetical protein
MILRWELLQRKNPASACNGTRVFLFVDKRFEISNQCLITDMVGIIQLEQELSVVR